MIFHHGIAILEPGDDFPDPRAGPADAPVAIGLDLAPALMLRGYRQGLFAWSANPVTWWSPDPRAIMSLQDLDIPKRLARKMKTDPFEITLDRAFQQVVRECARPRHRGDGVWITREFRDAFAELHALGYAHSVECWRGAELVGGIFGVAVGGFFSAESMFHRATDASKIALFGLLKILRAAKFELFDIQILTPHTQSLGAIEISRNEYLARLDVALQREVRLQGGVSRQSEGF